MEKADVADCLQTIGQDILEASPAQRDGIKLGRPWAGPAHLAGGDGARAVREADEPVVGERACEDIGGEGGDGGVAVVVGLAVDAPGGSPDLGIDGRKEASLLHGFFAERAVERGERFDRDKEGRSGGAPGRAIFGEATARDNRGDGGVVLQLPAPGVQNPGRSVPMQRASLASRLRARDEAVHMV